MTRLLLACLLGAGLGIAGTSLMVDRGDDQQTLPPIQVAGIPAPRLIGLSRTQAHCWMGRWSIQFVVDDELARGRTPRALCTGRMLIFPDPTVVRQLPFPGAALIPGQPLRVYTDCYGKRCI
jgi:hypothetical protein